jgi:hypothetical protein
MRALKIISFAVAIVLGIFGILSIITAGSGDPSVRNPTGTFITGAVLIIVAIVLVVIGLRLKPATQQPDNVTLKIDLPGNVGMDTIKCKSCGGTLSAEDVKMVAGAPVVTCPYCHTTYQLTEEPKW